MLFLSQKVATSLTFATLSTLSKGKTLTTFARQVSTSSAAARNEYYKTIFAIIELPVKLGQDVDALF